MGACLSKQQSPEPSGEPPERAAATQPLEIKAEPDQSQTAASDYASVQSADRDSSFASSTADYAGAPAPVCEINRRQHLLDLNIMHTAPEPRFDDITKLASMVFKVPIALVSLVDEKIQWFKSVQGLPVDSTPRNTSFCAWTLLPAYPEALVVEDAVLDARFKDNPLVVGAPFIRFYAGCPLVCSNGLRLGSLCIIDKVPRTFDAESCNMLANMAEMVVREIERDRELLERRLKERRSHQEHQQLLRAIDCFDDAIMMLDTSTNAWSIVFANEAWEKLVGRTCTPGTQLPFWDIFQVPASSKGQQGSVQFSQAVARQQNFELLLKLTHPSSGCNNSGPADSGGLPPSLYASAQFRCAANTGLDSHMPLIAIPNFLTSSDEASKFYFATLKLVQHVGSNEQPTGTNNDSLKLLPGRAASATFLMMQEPFEGIKLGQLLGRGSFGRVYRGIWNNSVVAVKVIEYLEDKSVSGSLLEGLLSEKVQHPNVVRTYKHMTRPIEMAEDENDGTDDEDCLSNGSTTSTMGKRKKSQLLETWLLLEFCNKGSLSDAVDKGWFRKRSSKREPNMEAILLTAREIASGLAYLHGCRILHGDLTGNNVLLSANSGDSQRSFTAKVSDFGLSRLISTDAPVIETRTYGTVTHMPPELLLMGQMSRAVDVYSFGVVCWEMFMGQRPYQGMSHSQVLHHVGQSGTPLQLPPSAPQGFRALVTACLNREPMQRPPMDQVLERLQELEVQLSLDNTC